VKGKKFMHMREGDLLKTKDNIIFDVKGLIHPQNRAVAFPRFVPSSSGNRNNGAVTYEKIYSIPTRFKFLEKNLPHYIVYDPIFDESLCEVPLEDIKQHYKPIDRLKELRYSKELDTLEADALRFTELLRRYSNTSWSKIGVSGSLLVKLHTQSSDIDLIFYGSKNCHKIHETLDFLTQDSESEVKAYTSEEMQKLFEFRVKDTKMSFKDFVRTESRKVLQGKFKRGDYFMRFVKDSNEIREKYGAIQYRNVGYARIKAEIEDSSEAIFTPCSYKLKNVKILNGTSMYSIDEIASFRGRFCEQARTSETVIAQGKVERVTDKWQNREHFRLLLGNQPSDYMVLA
jgi:predicted nucleotidyltransferase